MRFAEMFASWRHDHRMSLRVIAKEIGVPFATLQRFESGKEVEARILSKVLLWALEGAK